jgi:hypothetical protein
LQDQAVKYTFRRDNMERIDAGQGVIGDVDGVGRLILNRFGGEGITGTPCARKMKWSPWSQCCPSISPFCVLSVA